MKTSAELKGEYNNLLAHLCDTIKTLVENKGTDINDYGVKEITLYNHYSFPLSSEYESTSDRKFSVCSVAIRRYGDIVLLNRNDLESIIIRQEEDDVDIVYSELGLPAGCDNTWPCRIAISDLLNIGRQLENVL